MSENRDERIEAARTLVAAPIIVTLAHNLETQNPALVDRVQKSLSPLWMHIGELTISDAILQPYTLHLCTSEVPNGYRAEIAVPEGYENDIRRKFKLFCTAAQSFWAEWCETNSLIVSDGHLPTSLIFTETAWHWTATDPYWVGIFAYFTDPAGNKYKFHGHDGQPSH